MWWPQEVLDRLATHERVAHPNLTPAEYEALWTLARDRSIIIKKADKGAAVVVMGTTDRGGWYLIPLVFWGVAIYGGSSFPR